jgi:hypothetical protein
MAFKISRFASLDAICYSRTRAPDALFRGSSVVEQPAVNRLVVGSNPTRGAIPCAKPLFPITKAHPPFSATVTTEGLSVALVENMPIRATTPKSYHRIPASSAPSQTLADSERRHESTK